MKYAVLRIRSLRDKSEVQDRTLRQMHLTRVNHCSLLPIDESVKGRIKRVQHTITWGEINSDTLTVLLRRRAAISGGVTDELVSKHTDLNTVEEFAEALISGDTDFSDIPGLKNLFRLHPPLGGYKGIKKHVRNGGSIGYRGADINNLLESMLGPGDQGGK
ncbi:MAG: 50S ribosomal protein L30 [Thermoplasmata archaeon]